MFFLTHRNACQSSLVGRAHSSWCKSEEPRLNLLRTKCGALHLCKGVSLLHIKYTCMHVVSVTQTCIFIVSLIPEETRKCKISNTLLNGGCCIFTISLCQYLSELCFCSAIQ